MIRATCVVVCQRVESRQRVAAMPRAGRSATPACDHGRLLTLSSRTGGHGSLVPLTTNGGGWTPLSATLGPMRFFGFLYSLGHGAHRAGHRQQVVAAEVDLCQRGNVADG